MTMPQFEDADGRAITRENARNGWNEALNQPLFGYEELDKPFPDPEYVAPPYPYDPTPEQQKMEAATNKRYAANGKIHKSAGPSQPIPKPGVSASLYPKPNGAVISELTNKSWHLSESVPCAGSD